MSTHTPGPWELSERDDQVIRADTVRIATVECARSAWRANARLIASAPELLAALKSTIVRLECYERWASDEVIAGRGTPIEREILDDVRSNLAEIGATIAKAEGRNV